MNFCNVVQNIVFGEEVKDMECGDRVICRDDWCGGAKEKWNKCLLCNVTNVNGIVESCKVGRVWERCWCVLVQVLLSEKKPST